jgi:hypothetical protein
MTFEDRAREMLDQEWWSEDDAVEYIEAALRAVAEDVRERCAAVLMPLVGAAADEEFEDEAAILAEARDVIRALPLEEE